MNERTCPRRRPFPSRRLARAAISAVLRSRAPRKPGGAGGSDSRKIPGGERAEPSDPPRADGKRDDERQREQRVRNRVVQGERERTHGAGEKQPPRRRAEQKRGEAERSE